MWEGFKLMQILQPTFYCYSMRAANGTITTLPQVDLELSSAI